MRRRTRGLSRPLICKRRFGFRNMMGVFFGGLVVVVG